VQDALPALQIAAEAAVGHSLCFLDSVTGDGPSYVFADPVAVYAWKDGRGTLRWQSPRTCEDAVEDPFLRLGALLSAHPDLIAAGYWGYDLRRCLERLPHRSVDDLQLPDCWIGLYPRDKSKVQGSRSKVQSPGIQPLPHYEQRPAAGHLSPPDPHSHTPALTHLNLPAGLEASLTRPQYEAAVRRVLEYIAAGDCYQVNLSQRLTASLPCAAWELYERLRCASPAPYAAFIDGGDHQVLSSSPELFLRVRDRLVETRPIKGTRPRGGTPEEDAALREELQTSAKDRAELLMIVDLERNDLGRVCEYGSVHVPELFRLESYANVHHLVATVHGRLRSGLGPLDCLRAAFPGGSITGAPKIRAMEIIEELEPVTRDVYTGAVGWVDGAGNGEWNIAIRTMVARENRVYLHVGGGIVADSDPAQEYEETLAKARGMLQALGMQR
jgi:para-aminobenzoate synthetase component 1